jgi:hypothetical protein
MAQLVLVMLSLFLSQFCHDSCFVHAFIASFTALSLGMEDQPDYCEVVAMMLTSRQWRS